MQLSRTRLLVALGGGLTLLVALLVVLTTQDGDDQDPGPAAPDATQAPSAGQGAGPSGGEDAATPLPVVDTPPDSTLVVTLPGDVDRYAAPEADSQPEGTIPGSWHGRPSVLPVIDQRPGWLQVRLAQRPNQSTGWIRRQGVELATTPYRIQIDVGQRRLRLLNAGEVVLDAPAGIGRDKAPTPLGSYFVTFLQQPPDPTSGWGPFVVVTSAHSETISDFEQSGDAITAIHGPLGAEDQIGDDGAKISLGCVRLHLDDLAKLRDVPAGTPIDIVNTTADETA